MAPFKSDRGLNIPEGVKKKNSPEPRECRTICKHGLSGCSRRQIISPLFLTHHVSQMAARASLSKGTRGFLYFIGTQNINRNVSGRARIYKRNSNISLLLRSKSEDVDAAMQTSLWDRRTILFVSRWFP